jgi:hypothetical protein
MCPAAAICFDSMDLKSPPSRTPDAFANRFAVDDVPESTERLEAVELVRVLSGKIGRRVLLSPLNGLCVVDAHSSCANPLVSAIHLAFSRHLPLTLSPDAIWLTIVQGFSHHVNENAEAVRSRLVRHQGRLALNEQIRRMSIEDVTVAVAGFSRQIREATDPALHETLVCDFSTTTPDVRTASEIALMDTYSHYFEFSLEMCICGIPYITLPGTVQDWQRICDRVEVLETFGLDWWVKRLRPILQEFVRAAEGRPNPEFWRAIFKFRPATKPYDPEMVTGWVVDLFPYLGDLPGRRRNPVFDDGAKREVAAGAFPSGLCSVPVQLKLLDEYRQIVETQHLELVAGLLGVQQGQMDATVSPAISWVVARPAATKRH